MKLLSKFPFSVRDFNLEWFPIQKHYALYRRNRAGFLASRPNIVDWFPLSCHRSTSTLLSYICSLFRVICLLEHAHRPNVGDHLADNSFQYSFLIHFWTYSIIAWLNCMNKVSILCLTLFLGYKIVATLYCFSVTKGETYLFNMKYLWKMKCVLSAFNVFSTMN